MVGRAQLTDETDPFFLYTLRITEEEFQTLKIDQSILVDFAEFPSKSVVPPPQKNNRPHTWRSASLSVLPAAAGTRALAGTCCAGAPAISARQSSFHRMY